MIKWIRDFLGLCNHDWKILQTLNNVDSGSSYRYGYTVVVGKIYVMQCQKCGNIKRKEI